MKITDIIPQKRNPKRCNIYLDGQYFCGMDLVTLINNRLKVGCETDKEKLSVIQAESEINFVFDKALNLLDKSVKTEKQIREYLYKKGYAELTVNKVIEKLKRYNYINDKTYAERYIETNSLYKGKRLIAYELKLKGVGEKEIEEVTDTLENQDKAAEMVAEKYMKNKEKDFKNISRCYKYLLSKGFDYDTAKKAVEKYKSDDE